MCSGNCGRAERNPETGGSSDKKQTESEPDGSAGILGLCMLLLACGVSGDPVMEIFAAAGIPGRKNTLDLTTYEDTNFQIHMNFHTDTKDN